MKAVLKNIWKVGKGLVVRELDRNLFKDKEYVLDEGPWAFDGNILLTKEWTAYDVPGIRQISSFVKFLGDKIGTSVDCKAAAMLGIDNSLWFRVNVDLSEFCYGYKRLGYVFKACDKIDLDIDESTGPGFELLHLNLIEGTLRSSYKRRRNFFWPFVTMRNLVEHDKGCFSRRKQLLVWGRGGGEGDTGGSGS
ncbi:hypothetical protein Cgig2_014462 [Carnegiea gigantea]|uniref:DUF4283 domain-containing protein n=1 Tax=Carnegiea gigantea TaxID=171969 RepID=A0A9Q1K9B5_9CARY|nr:hypothetical protein Cgig2_014462 [Carnegiea gigantea]